METLQKTVETASNKLFDINWCVIQQGVAYKRGSDTPNGNLTKECNHQLKEIQLHRPELILILVCYSL